MHVCGPMHGPNPGNPDSGAFAEYLIQDRRLLVRVPDSWSDLEGAALGGVGWATVALAMKDSLQLTGTPSKPASLMPDGTRMPVLVYGGATATGTMAFMGCEVKLDGVYHRDADQSKFDLGVRWALEVQTLVDAGRFKCHPADVPTTESSAAYSWTNRDNAWRRKLGSMESFYLSLASPEGQPVHWMIGCSVTIQNHADTVNTEEALREAWKSIRRDFPCVGAVVDPAAQEIVLLLQSPHTLVDGRGMLYLYHALFTALSTRPGDDSQDYKTTGSPNLSKPYDEWLGVSAVPSQKNFADAQSIFQRVLQQERPIRLPGVDFATTSQRPVHRDLELTEEATSFIIGPCKQKGVTVTSAWHAALALATQSAAGEEGTSYVQFTTIDLRRYFPASLIPHKHSISSLQTALPLAADLRKDSTFDALS
ncbi:hypothetical protein DL768_001912 [Monosporascus sp. mg162]|nr:hypothetical protein DL768_001912 [Monosporascus sp. mg162]